ncbi:hypothetical protein DFJ58DRAFT_828984 [Suillus subalutaceus]|uniref:uncharacterized protein n=1 Tax=Suillus subalutaceus TaxID=48586 RepID=UPI001B861DAD|nr:uncharacterized protein DFJ58DRAFT_828984 [Suillus subalutaceus]KAG1826488.1 hypothetical protein DFJ58DRAFT_828984 [Suillus subalutaceus]
MQRFDGIIILASLIPVQILTLASNNYCNPLPRLFWGVNALSAICDVLRMFTEVYIILQRKRRTFGSVDPGDHRWAIGALPVRIYLFIASSLLPFGRQISK